jgi:hypothetical protein
MISHIRTHDAAYLRAVLPLSHCASRRSQFVCYKIRCLISRVTSLNFQRFFDLFRLRRFDCFMTYFIITEHSFQYTMLAAYFRYHYFRRDSRSFIL